MGSEMYIRGRDQCPILALAPAAEVDPAAAGTAVAAALQSFAVLVPELACSWVRPNGLHQRYALVHGGLGGLVVAT